MFPTDALRIIVQYLVAWGGGYLVSHGMLPNADSTVIGAATDIALFALTFGGPVLIALWKSTLRQKIKSIVAQPDVASVHVTPALANKLDLPAADVVPTPPAQH